MKPSEAVASAVAQTPGALCVSSLGTATSALRLATDDGPHFYLGGAMGCGLAVALGVADARPDRPVMAVVGDGDLLMGAGSLWSLSGLRPTNLLVLILDDGRYAITGGQEVIAPAALAAVVGGCRSGVSAGAHPGRGRRGRELDQPPRNRPGHNRRARLAGAQPVRGPPTGAQTLRGLRGHVGRAAIVTVRVGRVPRSSRVRHVPPSSRCVTGPCQKPCIASPKRNEGGRYGELSITGVYLSPLRSRVGRFGR